MTFKPKTYEEYFESNELYKKWFYEHIELIKKSIQIDSSIKIILGGSRAYDLAYDESDFDIYFVSDDFDLLEKTRTQLEKFYLNLLRQKFKVESKRVNGISSLNILAPYKDEKINVRGLDILFISTTFYETITKNMQDVIEELFGTSIEKKCLYINNLRELFLKEDYDELRKAKMWIPFFS